MTDRIRTAMRVSVCSIIINFLLSLFKLLAGIVSRSGALISDAVHSASDVFSTLIVMTGIRFSDQKADREHPYGHERLECVAAVLLAVVLALTGVGIAVNGIERVRRAEVAAPGLLALAAAALSIVVKELMFWITRRVARRISSDALLADAWHHRSDAFSSVASLIAVAGAMLGLPILDPIASVVIAVLIVKAAYTIAKDGIYRMLDTSCDEKTTEAIRKVILEQEGVLRIDDLKTRLFGSKFYVDVEIAEDSTASLLEAHAVAERVHRAIEAAFPNAKHCMVHVNPLKREEVSDE